MFIVKWLKLPYYQIVEIQYHQNWYVYVEYDPWKFHFHVDHDLTHIILLSFYFELSVFFYYHFTKSSNRHTQQPNLAQLS